MNKLRTAKGSLKDHNRFLADEIDDYAEQPDDYDQIFNLTNNNPNTSQSHIKVALKKTIAPKKLVKMASSWPKFKPDFNFEVASQGIFNTYFGENLAKFLTISDVAKLLRTCSYLHRMFSKTSIWLNYTREIFGNLKFSNNVLSQINIMQYAKYLRYASYDDNMFFKQSDKIKMKNDGIVFDTVVIAKNMKDEEEKLLARNMVDFVTVKSQKTLDTINKLVLKGTLTGDIKISWMKEMNEVCVWVAGYHVQSENLQAFAGILLNRKYQEESQLVKGAYFLNDQYFVIEIEEKSEDDQSVVKTFEVFTIEPEDNWFEKKEVEFCKQVLKQSFVEKMVRNIKIKMVGDFLVFLLEEDKNKFSVHIFGLNGNDNSPYKSGVFCLDAGFYEAIASRIVTKSCFSIYLLDKELNIYILSYSHGSGTTLKKLDQQKKIQEEESKSEMSSNAVRKYHYGTYKIENKDSQSQTLEYLMICKEKKFYLTKFETNELVPCDPPYNYNKDPKVFNWTICGNFLYLFIDTMIQIYQLNFKDYSAVYYRTEKIRKLNFWENTACWILVNPCLTILMSAGSFDKAGSLQLLIGSTQRLLMKPDWYDPKVHFDECCLDKMLEEIDLIECKFEDERLLVQEASGRSYFRDFNVCEKRVEKEKYGWKVQTKYDLNESSIVSIECSKEIKTIVMKKELIFENKNHENSQKRKKRNQNWKNIEKKVVTDEKLEKKENRKKGEKYYKNVRQGKHLKKNV